MIRIAVTGPESTGKSTLARQLALHLRTVWVPEYARTYINHLNRPYQERDLLQIARGQLAAEVAASPHANDFLICDTELTVIHTWAMYKYERIHPWVLQEMQKVTYDLYLLMDVDLPWEEDPQREHPHLRQYFFDIYYQSLKSRNLTFTVIRGSFRERLHTAIKAIQSLA